LGVQVTAEFRDPNFNPEQTPEYKLSVLIGVDSLCFEVLESRTNKSLLIREYAVSRAHHEAEVLEILDNTQILQNTGYHAVRFGIGTDRCALVPHRFFNPGNLAEYWETIAGKTSEKHICADKILPFDAHLIYPLPQSLLARLIQIQPHCRVFHSVSSWLTSVQQLSKTMSKSAIFAHINGNQGFVAALDSGSLLFFNRFLWQTSKDFIYHTLLALNQSRFQLDSTFLIFSGKVTPDAEVTQLSQRYFPSLEMASSPLAFSFPNDFPQAQQHWYFELTSFRWF
jgi:hypothetical protein